LVWFVIEAVGRLDLSGFGEPAADPRGRRRYDPAILVALVVYAYCVGERSSRRIERRCWEDVAFRVAAADLKPDHTTISRFLKDHAEAFDALFVQVLMLAARMGVSRVGTLVVDGTKVAADASPLAGRTRRRLEEQVRAITGEARRIDADEDEIYGDATGEELPAELAEPGLRQARLEEALAELEAEEVKDAARPPARRRKQPFRVNLTDPQSRVVKGPRGYFPGYNAQAVVDGDGLIVGADVTNDQADNHQFEPMVDQACQNLDAAGLDRPQRVVADNGYWTNNNATWHRAHPPHPQDGPARPEPFIAPPTDPRRRLLATRGPIPRDATPAQIMQRKLATKAGAAI
jgi:transposase